MNTNTIKPAATVRIIMLNNCEGGLGKALSSQLFRATGEHYNCDWLPSTVTTETGEVFFAYYHEKLNTLAVSSVLDTEKAMNYYDEFPELRSKLISFKLNLCGLMAA